MRGREAPRPRGLRDREPKQPLSSAETLTRLLMTCLLEGGSGPGEQATMAVGPPEVTAILGGIPGLVGGLLLMINFNLCLLPCGIFRRRAAKKVHSFLDPSRTLTLKMTDRCPHIHSGFPVFNFRFQKKKKSISMFYRNLKTLVKMFALIFW